MERLPAPFLGQPSSGQPVASYRDLGGATLAAAQLVEAGHPAASIRIVPRSLEPLRPRIPVREGAKDGERLARWCTAAGAAVGAATWWLRGGGGGDFLVGVVVGLLAGVVLALAVRLREVLARRRARRLRSLVRAERFDVVVSPATAPKADHLLARWWDPAAVPAPPPSRVDGGAGADASA